MAFQQFQDAQDSANAANKQRYTKGLQILRKGTGKSAGLMRKGTGVINDAIRGVKNMGRKELRDIESGAAQAHSVQQQSAINRGIGNTTITDALHRGIDSDRRENRLNVLDRVAAARSGLLLNKANQLGSRAGMTQSGAGSIAQFIASRNDVGPSLSDLAPLIQGAASDAGNVQRRGTVTSGGGGALGSGGTIGSGTGGGSISGAISGGISGGGIGILPSSPGGGAEYIGPSNPTPAPVTPPPAPPSVGPTITPTNAGMSGSGGTTPWWMYAPGGRRMLTNIPGPTL